MNQVVSLQVQGLITNENEVTTSEGALLVADDIVIDKHSVAQLRRGFEKVVPLLSDCQKLMTYQDHLIAVTGKKISVIQNSQDSWTPFKGEFEGTFHSAQAHSNLYFTTSYGLMKMDALTDPVLAGVPKALDMTATPTDQPTEAGGFLPKDMQVAYRVVWGYKDAHQNLCLGAPSARCVVTYKPNSSDDKLDDKKVKLQFSIPKGITEKHFYQVYRSDPALEASDELALSFQSPPTKDQLKEKKVTVIDTKPKALTGAALYTNATQEGILQGNSEPPIAKDIALFRDCLFYANTAGFHRLFISLKTIGGSDGLSVGDVITIAGKSYLAAEEEGSNAFKLFHELSSLAITHTVSSFVRVMNRGDSEVFAYGLETSDDGASLGKILLESRSPFDVKISAHHKAFYPELPNSSSNDVHPNAVYFSKYRQFESVPLLNSFVCGEDSQAIHRLIPLRDGLFALTEGGVYRIGGYSPESFYREVFDSTVKLMAPESAAVLSNHIFCLTNQGVVAINDSGVIPVSRSIENLMLALISPSMVEVTKKYAFALTYESERKYILFTPTCPSDTCATQAFVYNIFTKAWTRWKLTAHCGLIHPLENKIYLGNPWAVLAERKSGTESDYFDEELRPVQGRIEWAPQYAGSPFQLKQWAECSVSFQKKNAVQVDFKTELSPFREAVELLGNPHYFRTYLPAQKQLAALQYVGLTCQGPFELKGISLSVTGRTSERITR